MPESQATQLSREALDRISSFIGSKRGLGGVKQLPLRRLVADYCEKFIALDRAGVPAAFIVLSPRSHPEAVREAARMTETVRAALGPVLGDAVLLPHYVGDLEGCSYSITQYCTPMSSNRWKSRWQRFRLSPSALSWLSQVARDTARPLADAASLADLRQHLEALTGHRAVTARTRQSAAEALHALARGEWRPRSVVAHNDLWWGNFVQRPPTSTRARTPFYVIDWAGSNPAGVPFYDLVRLARSMNVSRARAHHEMTVHCESLECDRTHVAHYLSAAFGALACHLGEWPEQLFARAADECLLYTAGVLA